MSWRNIFNDAKESKRQEEKEKRERERKLEKTFRDWWHEESSARSEAERVCRKAAHSAGLRFSKGETYAPGAGTRPRNMCFTIHRDYYRDIYVDVGGGSVSVDIENHSVNDRGGSYASIRVGDFTEDWLAEVLAKILF